VAGVPSIVAYWSHSILEDESFIGPWEALENAAHWHFELCDLTRPISQFTWFPSAAPSKTCLKSSSTRSHVTFAPALGYPCDVQQQGTCSLPMTDDWMPKFDVVAKHDPSLFILSKGPCSDVPSNPHFDRFTRDLRDEVNEVEVASSVHNFASSSLRFPALVRDVVPVPSDPVPPSYEEPLPLTVLSPQDGLPVIPSSSSALNTSMTTSNCDAGVLLLNDIHHASGAPHDGSPAGETPLPLSSSTSPTDVRPDADALSSASWMLTLRSLWREFAVREYVDDSRVIYVETWYIHHIHDSRCERSRTVRFDHLDHHWYDDIRQQWPDKIRTDELLHLVSVAPTPPRADRQRCVAHILLLQGARDHHVGAVFTARFLEDHTTHLIQAALSVPDEMSGTRAIAHLRVEPFVEHRRWIARSGAMLFDILTPEAIPNGISIIVDVKVESPPAPDDVTSLAAFSHETVVPQPGVADMPEAVQQEDDLVEVEVEISDSDTMSDSPDTGEDWRFVHVCLLGKKIHHGRLPWYQPDAFFDAASELTGIPADDLVHLHYVRHGPDDLRAAHVEPLIAQVYDLPLGSLKRLVLLDVEFHEQFPAREASTSRRCIALPRVSTRAALLRAAGLDIYCQRSRDRCLMWHNGSVLQQQSVAPFDINHGDYIRIAVPPWPFAPAHISTRACVSRIRQRPRRMDYASLRPHDIRDHEDGMTDIDAMLERDHPHAVQDAPDDEVALYQLDVTVQSVHSAQHPVISEVPSDKIDFDFQECRSRLQAIGHRNEALPVPMHGQPAIVHDLYLHLLRHQRDAQTGQPPALVAMTWYSDHLRRPHSGIGREVHLRADFTTWYHDLVMAWQEWVDPFADILWRIVQPHPEDGDPDVSVHVLLVQHPQHDCRSIITAITDSADDPWHPRLLCLRVPALLTHSDLQQLVDLDGDCTSIPQQHWCRTWYGEHDMTSNPGFPVDHGASLVFSIQRNVPWMMPAASGAALPDLADNEAPDDLSLLQQRGQRQHLVLENLVEPPRFTEVDCQRPLFLRNQLCLQPRLQPCETKAGIWWHTATWSELQDLPHWAGEPILGMTLYTDGTAQRHPDSAAAAVVLLLHVEGGLRWGGYLSAPCLGDSTAPRAEATALLLATLWIRQLLAWRSVAPIWFEIAYDCDHTARIAQGHQAPEHNLALLTVLRSIVQWIETQLALPLTWTHIRSHCQHPWNEAADTVCRYALQHQDFTTDLTELYNQCTFNDSDVAAVQWIWLIEKSLRQDVDAPMLIAHRWRFDVAGPFSTQPRPDVQPAVQRRRVDVCAESDARVLNLRTATANVLTLFPGRVHCAGFLGARVEDLDAQFVAAGVHVVGLQETRSTSTGHHTTDSFHVLSGPATGQGRGGVQLWIRRIIQTSHGRIDVQTADLRILHATSRRLIVRWAHPGVRLLFVVLHAPDHDDEDRLQAFWDATTTAIPREYHSWHTIVLIDANSRVGSVTSSSIGPHHADAENVKGTHFHSWLVNHAMFLPQTFERCHRGSSSTWTHPGGAQARLDYIAISTNIGHQAVYTWIATDIDLTVSRPDHACVCADIQLGYYDVDRRPRHERFVSSTVGVQPVVSWDVDVHTHAARIQQWLRSHCKPQRTWRKQHLSEHTRTLVLAKRHHWKRLGELRRHHRQGILRQLFVSWRSGRRVTSAWGPWIRQCDRDIAWHTWAYHDLLPRVVTAIRQDDKAFYEQLAERAGDESRKSCHALWAAIQHALPRWRCKRRSNLRCTGPTIPAQFGHYDNLEAGHAVRYEDLLAQCHAHQRDAALDIPLQIALADLPSRLDIELHGSRIKTNKAAGIDSVTPATVKGACQNWPSIVHQLMLKIWVLGAEPTQFKGGILHPIAKKEASQCIEGMRGIMLIDCLGKLVHSHLRRQFAPQLCALRHPLQLGGFARCSTLFATQYVRSFTIMAHEMNLSSAVLFIDIRSAFHSMIRAFAFDINKDLHPKLAQVLRESGLDIDVIQQQLRSTRPFDSMVPPVVARLLQDSHCHTWFTLGQSGHVHQTERGSRPGSPLADVAFNALMTHVLKELQHCFDHHSPLQNAFARLGMRAAPVAWVDDLAIPVVSLTAAALTDLAVWALNATKQICASFGLELNLKQHKTEVVPSFRGAGAPACRTALFHEHYGVLCLQPDDPLSPIVRCVSQYEHLGTTYQSDGGIAAELRHRVGRAQRAHRQVRKPILMNRHLAIRTRLRLLEALILPVLLHGAGNWQLLTATQIKSLHVPYLRWIRSIVGNGFWADDQLPDEHILLAWGLPSIPLRLAKLRLLYAYHWIADAPHDIIACVTAVASVPGSWFSALRCAIAWGQTIDPAFYEGNVMTDSAECICHWLVHTHPNGPRWVRRLYRQALQQGQVIGTTMTLHYELQRAFLQGGATCSNEIAASQPSMQPFVCRFCARSFDSPRALQAHLWCAHGEASEERRFMSSTTCTACWKCFWTVNRLQIHLHQSRQYEGGCYERLTWTQAPWEDVIEIDEGDTALLPARMPAQPVPHTATRLATSCTSAEEAHQCWQDAWEQEGMTFPLDNHWDALCRERCDEAVRTLSSIDDIVWRLVNIADGDGLPPAPDGMGSWVLSLWLLDDLCYARFPSMSVEMFGRLFREVRRLVHQSPIGSLVCWRRRMETAHRPHAEPSTSQVAGARPVAGEAILNPVQDQCNLLHPILAMRFTLPSCQGIPMQVVDGKRIVWILHLFSGRRRIGDCHWWLTHIGRHLWRGVELRMISLDTAVHDRLGNLDESDNYNMVLKLAQKGLIAGVLAGPPCETWSAARNILLPDHTGPRPLRTSDQPWLLSHRTGKEMRQTSTGTRLLLNTWRIETSVVLHGGGALKEHPWENGNLDRASVWRTTAHKDWIMQLPDAFRHYIEQYLYGAAGTKPTCLRALNLGEAAIVQQALHEGMELWRARPVTRLMGRNHKGEFRTAAAKEYTSALCRSMLVALLTGLRRRFAVEGSRASPILTSTERQWLENAWSASHVVSMDSFLPDYQGT